MKIITCTNHPDDELEEYRRSTTQDRWELAISGYWSEDSCHSGHIAYYIQRTAPDTWVLNGVERNTELDAITEADIRKGRLNDDQMQAMWGMTLKEAQSQRYERIVAVLLDAPEGLSSRHAATHLYQALEEADGKVVDEPDGDGLLG